MTTMQYVHRVPPRLYPEHFMFSAMTPIGQYQGGYVVLPQLKKKIVYDPGCVVFLRPSLIYYGITDYVPKAMSPSDVLRPGRISLTFYLHKEAYDALREHVRIVADFTPTHSRRARKRRRNLKRKASCMEDEEKDEDEEDDEDELLVYEIEDGEIADSV